MCVVKSFVACLGFTLASLAYRYNTFESKWAEMVARAQPATACSPFGDRSVDDYGVERTKRERARAREREVGYYFFHKTFG